MINTTNSPVNNEVNTTAAATSTNTTAAPINTTAINSTTATTTTSTPEAPQSFLSTILSNTYVRIGIFIVIGLLVGSIAYEATSSYFAPKKESLSSKNKKTYVPKTVEQVEISPTETINTTPTIVTTPVTTPISTQVSTTPINNTNTNSKTNNTPIVNDDLSNETKLSRIKSSPMVKHSSTNSSESSKKYKYTDLTKSLEKGKLIKANVSSYTSSLIQGHIEAVVSQNIYSSQGNNILIPKGSKIFGSVDKVMSLQLKKILFNWTEIQLPNGYTLTIPMKSIDYDGSKGDTANYINNAPKRIFASLSSNTAQILINMGADILTGKINEVIGTLSSDNSTQNVLSSYLKTLNNASPSISTINTSDPIITNLSNLLSSRAEFTTYLSQFQSILAEGQNGVVEKQQVSAFIISLLSSLNKSKEYIAKNTLNVSNMAAEEIKNLFGMMDDYLSKRIGDFIYISVAENFEIPRELMNEQEVLR